MKINWKRAALGAAAVVVLIQFVPVRHDNPPVTAEIAGPGEVVAVLRASCFDCHSHLTRWPGYSYVAPVSWLVASDVHEARSKMNFSEWGKLDADAQAFLRKDVYKEVSEGEMPLWYYLLMHPKAKLTPEALGVLKQWSEAAPAP